MSKLKRVAKGVVQQFCPFVLEWRRTVRNFRRFRGLYGEFQREFQRTVYGSNAITVLSGPFQGMSYFNKVVWGLATPKWIGSYEAELHQVVCEIVAARYDYIVDLGAAEGYYAVGLARTCPTTHVFTFETDFIARRRQRELAALNGVVAQLTICGRVDSAVLNSVLAKGRCVVISDIEGAETELIDPTKTQNLRHVDVLVECHFTESQTVDEVVETIRERFVESHRIEEVCSCHRSLDSWRATHPSLLQLSGEQLAFATNEFRYPQKWLWLKAK